MTNTENIIAGGIGGILLLIGLRICYKNPDCTFFSRDDDNNDNDNDNNDNDDPNVAAGKIKKTKKNKKQKKGKSKKHYKK
jgi:hypothetical protein